MSHVRKRFFNMMDNLVSIIIFLVALRLLLYMATSLYATGEEMLAGDFWMERKTPEILHWIIYFIVMVKAYKILIFYARFHRVEIKYVTELVIVTSFVEIIFQIQELNNFKIAILGAIGALSLIAYLFYYDRLSEISDQNSGE